MSNSIKLKWNLNGRMEIRHPGIFIPCIGHSFASRVVIDANKLLARISDSLLADVFRANAI
jgi:hypothetical protein